MTESALDGWQAAPKRANKAMEMAAFLAVRGYHDLGDDEWAARMPGDLFRLAWPAMLAAAPPANAPDGWQPVETAPVDGTPMPADAPKLIIEFHQHDFIPGFAAFLPGATTPQPDSRAFCVLNVGAFLAAIATGDADPAELPYAIAESMMHEVIHVLEQHFRIKFSEDRIEALIDKYRAKYGRNAEDQGASDAHE